MGARAIVVVCVVDWEWDCVWKSIEKVEEVKRMRKVNWSGFTTDVIVQSTAVARARNLTLNDRRGSFVILEL